jgi:hypothetical protein
MSFAQTAASVPLMPPWYFPLTKGLPRLRGFTGSFKTSLVQPDDIGIRDLNPSEDWKSSCLAGLSPEMMFS